MNRKHPIRETQTQRGAALLIAIFALLLVSVVAIALIVSSGTDTALASNYRTSTSSYYAALAGVEEARGRMLATNPNYIPLPVSPMDLTQVLYIINPAGGETVAPWNTADPTTYPDNEYQQEFGVDVSTRVVTNVLSVSPSAGLPGPSFKWVRINAVTEQTLGDGPASAVTGLDVNGDGSMDALTPLFYDPAHLRGSSVVPGLIENATPPRTAGQALQITSYASLPTGGRKMLQYVIRPMIVLPGLNNAAIPNVTLPTVPTFPAALTLAGNNVSFVGPATNSFYIRGQDQCAGSPALMPAIGFTNSGDNSKANVVAGANPAGNYQGPPINPGPPPTPAGAPQTIMDVSTMLNPNWLTPGGLDAVVQDITNNADAVIQGPATSGNLPSGITSRPMTVVVNGDLDLNAWHNTGNGLLLVTGTLKYDPDASWEGVVLVIGQGNFVSTKGGTGGIDGALFIAKTRDASNNLLGTLGAASFSQTGGGGPGANLGRGINFNSCVAQSVVGPITFKVLAFREIPLPN